MPSLRMLRACLTRLVSMRLLTSIPPVIAVALFITLAATNAGTAQSSVRPPDSAISATGSPTGGAVPGDALGTTSDAEIWRAVREGVSGNVSIPDKKAGVLVQSEGESWRLLRNGPMFDYLGLAMIGTLILLALFFAIRGRIRVEHGLSGVKIKRFSTIERTGHWLMALSFIILAISGLNVSFGRSVIIPLIGKEAFGPISEFLKLSHNYVAFAFMLGLAIAFVTWIAHNLPNRHDLVWLAHAGGLFSKNVHPPAKKFNAGQKIIFWLVMLGGLSLAVSGWALLFPFEHRFFGDTFTGLASIGLDIPALLGLPQPPYSAILEQQFNTVWHVVMAVFMICVIFGHIYIGSIGMEGAFGAVGSGKVDLNWAREHHSLWVDGLREKDAMPPAAANPEPAE